MNRGRAAVSIQIRARMIKDATGTDFTAST